MGYDDAGHRTTETDELSRTTTFKYDCESRLYEVDDATLPTAQKTTYAYDEVGNRISQTDAKLQTTLIGYDPMGRETSRTYPNGDSDERVRAAAAEAGYLYGVAVTPQKGPASRFNLGRRMMSEASSAGISHEFDESVFLARVLGVFG